MAKINKSQIKTFLENARELIAEEQNWTKGVPARDVEGKACLVASDDAEAFCALGAVARVAEANTGRFENNLVYSMALDHLSKALEWKPITDFNDDPKTTHQDILSLFDKAIKGLV